jgi:hypothetical protein
MNGAITRKAVIKTTAAMFALLFMLGQSGAYAADENSSSSDNKTSSNIRTRIISSVKHVENFYNAFGVCYMSTETSKTVTETTSSSTANGETKTNSSTTVQESFVMQTWKGGSLKPDYSTSVSTTTGTDGSSSVTNSKVTYSYDDAGRLSGAIGTAHTEGTLASDAYGGSGGSYVSDQTTTYVIKNAQALPSQTVTDTTTTVEGQVKSTSHEVTTFEYELIGGTWHLMKEVSNSSTSMTDGGSEQRTTIKTYTRDANGVCTGVSQTCTGTSVSVDDNGGTWTYSMTNYNAEFQFDEVLGWYLASESYDWELTSKPDTGSASGAQSVESANEKLVENPGSDAENDSGSDAAASSENVIGDRRKIMPVYNEKRETEIENQVLKFQKAAQQRKDDSTRELSAFHKKSREQQAELEKQLEDFRRAAKERREEINRQIERFERNFGVYFHHFLYN